MSVAVYIVIRISCGKFFNLSFLASSDGNINFIFALCCRQCSNTDNITVQASADISNGGIVRDIGEISVQEGNDTLGDAIAVNQADSHDILAVSDEDIVLGLAFKDLQKLVDDAPEGSEISLDNDYYMASGGHTIKILKSITINGAPAADNAPTVVTNLSANIQLNVVVEAKTNLAVEFDIDGEALVYVDNVVQNTTTKMVTRGDDISFAIVGENGYVVKRVSIDGVSLELKDGVM